MESPVDICIFNYPIETEEAKRFWSSNHKSNIAKAFVAFSLDEDNYNELAKRHHYSREWRDRVWSAYGSYVNTPSMAGVPYSELEDIWWNDMPNICIGNPIDSQPYIVAITPGICDLPEVDTYEIVSDVHGTGPVTYQWHLDGVPILGATDSSYTVPASTPGSYTLEATNSFGSVYSQGVVVGVKYNLPVVSSSPESHVIPSGDSVTLSVSGSGYDSISWYKNGTELVGEVSENYTATAVRDSVDSYYARLCNQGGCTDTAQSTITAITIVPEITQQPTLGGVSQVSSSLVINSTGTNFDSIQWYKVNRLTGKHEPVPGQSSNIFTDPSPVYTGFLDKYYVEYTNANSTTRSETIDVYISNT